MALGDLGGPVTELIVTCRTKASGEVDIAEGDAVALVGDYEVDLPAAAEDPVIGQALASTQANGAVLPVRVRGVCVFDYSGTAPAVDGETGVLASGTPGLVKTPGSGSGVGLVLKTDTARQKVDVLI